MLVTRKNLEETLSQLTTGVYAVDTETTGLRSYHGDRLFSLIIASGTTSWYFNFKEYPGLDEDFVLPRADTLWALRVFFDNTENIIYMQNAKFDLAMLANEVVHVSAKIYDTEVMGRLLYNRHVSYSLSTQCKAIGLDKSEEVSDYIAKHKLFTWVTSPGKAKREKKPHFDQVPFDIISRYGEIDGTITWKLGEHQRSALERLSGTMTSSGNSRTLLELLEVEASVTKTCFAMERAGIKIDRSYCQEAYTHEKNQAAMAAAEFESISGMALVDSRTVLSKAFTAAGEVFPVTENGNASFTDEVLEGFDSPLAKTLQEYRRANKRATTYYANFLYYADFQDRIHPNMRQAGTDTGRFSFAEPNLQNVPKDDEGPYPVRRAFVPESSDYMLVCIDYEQMEYRLLLDYANERDVIRSILEDGLDVHQATADKMGVERTPAKTLNFLLLYGGGAQALADAIKVPLGKAQELKTKYFEALPGIRRFSQGIMERANTRGWIFNWAGRVCHFPYGSNPKTGKLDRFAYRAANHCIQGGCADIVKIAMVGCQDHLAGTRSRLLLQVHDELVFEIHKNEHHLVDELKEIMERAYPHRYLPLTCSVDYSAKSWGDKQPWPQPNKPNDISML
jgi:DNA polymerase-1